MTATRATGDDVAGAAGGCKPGALCMPADIAANVRSVTRRIGDDKLRYTVYQPASRDVLQDCSGIFLRVLAGLAPLYPGYAFPRPDQRRSTRALAMWYLDRGQLTVIAGDRNALANDDLIRTGAVMFYGRSTPYEKTRAAYDGLTLAKLRSSGGDGVIDHMGIVTEVLRDPDSGDVLDYTIFHGHGPPRAGRAGEYASVTHLQKRDPAAAFRSCEGSTHALPSGKTKSKCAPLGYWNQPWVAVAPVVDARR